MVQIKTRKSGNKRVLLLSGSLTVLSSKKIWKALLHGLQNSRGLELVVEDAKEVDLSFLQIMVCGWKMAREENKKFSLRLPLPEPLLTAAALSGMDNHGDCTGAGCPLCAMAKPSSGV